jgi:hypothetical protein
MPTNSQLEKINVLLGWAMTGLLTVLAAFSVGLGTGEFSVSEPGISLGLLGEAIALCPKTPIPWLLRAILAVLLAAHL